MNWSIVMNVLFVVLIIAAIVLGVLYYFGRKLEKRQVEAQATIDAAKQVVVDFWGLTDEVGEGKRYPTNDDAIASITGYNREMAREYFNKAYDIAIEEGLMDEDDVIEIIIGLPATTSAYVNGYEFIVNNYTEAVKGTKLEGKLTFKKDDTIGNAFGDALRNNQVDMLFYVGWSGSEFDPYSLIEAYVSPAYQYDPCWDSTTTQVEIELDGVTYTASAYEWYESVNGVEIQATNVDTKEKVGLVFPYSRDEKIAADRLEVLAALEGTILQNYDFIPLTGDATAQLKGMQIEYHTEEEQLRRRGLGCLRCGAGRYPELQVSRAW